MSTSVFVTGGSGYIGSDVAKGFRRAGYKVYALVRSQEKARELLKNEVIPVIGDQGKPETYREYVKQAAIVIDNVGDYENVGLVNRLLLKTAAEESVEGVPKKIYIFTSGLLIYGDRPDIVVDETTPLHVNPGLQWRVDIEKEVLAETRVNGLIIRPGFVYGLSGSLSGVFFGHPGEKLVIKGKKDRKWPWVHVADMTEAYLLAVRRIAVAKGEIFNISTASAPTNEELHLKAAKLAGFQGPVEYRPRDQGWWPEISDVTVVANPQKAIDVLGWQPRHLGIVEELEISYQAFKAHNACQAVLPAKVDFYAAGGGKLVHRILPLLRPFHEGEALGLAAEREVEEETGIKAQFQGIINFRHMHPHLFSNSDLYFVALLKPLAFEATMQEEEIDEVFWMPIDEYRKSPSVNVVNQRIANLFVESLEKGWPALGIEVIETTSDWMKAKTFHDLYTLHKD